MSTPRDNGGPATIQDVNGRCFKVSRSDLPIVLVSRWRIGPNGYVYRAGTKRSGENCLLHRIITGAYGKNQVHHISGDKLDNRRENLEILNPSEHQIKHHVANLIARNRSKRKYSELAICVSCGVSFVKHSDHRGRQTCCSKRCATRRAVLARKAMLAARQPKEDAR